VCVCMHDYLYDCYLNMYFILEKINLFTFFRFMSSFNRPNLRYSIISKKGKNCSYEVVAMIMTKFKNTCGIVYCLSRKDCDDYTAHLKKNGIKALSYHAGLSDDQRSNCQGRWISDEVYVLHNTNNTRIFTYTRDYIIYIIL